MSVPRRLLTVDVFTAVPFMGNPVAVVLDGAGLDTAAMQRFANWTNLSETTFVLPASDPGADYALRIFTPFEELPFAGHPTLGSAHAVLEAGLAVPRDGKLVQQCAAGLVEIDCRGPGLSFRLPRCAVKDAPAPALDWLGGVAVNGAAKAIDVGPVWLVAELADAGELAGLEFDRAAFGRYQLAHAMTGTTLFAVGARWRRAGALVLLEWQQRRRRPGLRQRQCGGGGVSHHGGAGGRWQRLARQPRHRDGPRWPGFGADRRLRHSRWRRNA